MVEILGRYSKSPQPKSRVGQAQQVTDAARLSENSTTTRDIPKTHAIRRRLRPDVLTQLVDDYKAGTSSVALARSYCVSVQAVLDEIRRAGIEPRQRPGLSESEVKELHTLRAAGWSHRQLAERYKVSRQAISRRLSRVS